jgi:hypothetical protein
MTRQLLAAALLCFGALAAGCSAAAPSARSAPGVSAGGGAMASRPLAVATVGAARSSRSTSTAFNDADVRYTQQMVAEDEQVLSMAKLPQVKSSGGVVPTLAYAAAEELPSRIAQYRGWLATWKKPIPGALGTGDLGTVNGTQFPAAFMALFLVNQKAVLAAATQEASAGSFGPARQDAANAVAVTTRTIGSIPPG